ncbi:MAG: MarR family winged helix-turn-helix transcriptional regulator [Acidimicrobiales bacterium]
MILEQSADRANGAPIEPDLGAARLRIAVARMARRLRPTAAAGSLTATEVDVLVAAERLGPVRLSDLAAFTGLNPTMLSRLVPKLEELGLIHRLADETDRRACLVEAGAKGRRLLEKVRTERTDALSKVLSQLDQTQRQALAAALPAVEEICERLIRQPGPTEGGRR